MVAPNVVRRLNALADGEYVDADAKRLAKRLSRHRDWLFTFLDYPEVPWENNFTVCQIQSVDENDGVGAKITAATQNHLSLLRRPNGLRSTSMDGISVSLRA